MTLFPQDAFNEGVRKREVFGWAMYDFANSGYTTVVLTAVFNAYFVSVVADDALGHACLDADPRAVERARDDRDAGARRLRRSAAAKKRLLAIGTQRLRASPPAMLAWAGRGDVALAVVADGAVEHLLFDRRIADRSLPAGTRSARGVRAGVRLGLELGYFGGMLSLGLSLAYVLAAQARGEPPTAFVPVTMIITAGVYGARVARRRSPCCASGRCRSRGPCRAGFARRCAARSDVAPGARAFRDFVAARCGALLSSRHLGGDRAGCGVCRTDTGFRAGADHDAGVPGQHRGRAGCVRIRLWAGPHRPQAGAGPDVGRMDSDDGARGARHRAGRCSGSPR